MTPPAITAVASWYGSNRQLAHEVGARIRVCKPRWLGIPFAGGMCELSALADDEFPKTILCSDLHPHVMNLAACIANPILCGRLTALVAGIPHDVRVLEAAQARCRQRERPPEDWFGRKADVIPDSGDSLDWAVDYFVCVWMARNGTAGTKKEFNAPLSVRWDGNGGDSVLRVRNAADGLAAWQRIMRRCGFLRLDVFAFLDKVNDDAENFLYIDPPFPGGPGDDYKYSFTEADHRRLAKRLAAFKAVRILCRFYDHPLIASLYPVKSWKWEFLTGGKDQTNAEKPEVLISRRVA